jgi:hypothetical protein
MSDASGDQPFPAPPPAPPPPPPPPHFAAPPGYASYSADNRGAFGAFQRIGGVAKPLQILVLVIMVVQVALVLFLVVARNKAQDFINGSIDADAFKRGVGFYVLFGGVSFAVQIAVLVLTMVWMSKMARNQITLGREGTWGPGWAVAAWFLPPCVL